MERGSFHRLRERRKRVYVGREVRAVRGDYRKFRGGHHGFGHSLDTERCINVRNAPDFHRDIAGLERRKAADGNFQRVHPWLKMNQQLIKPICRITSKTGYFPF
jgi:hypothetical protein